jgi:hypothetical protein
MLGQEAMFGTGPRAGFQTAGSSGILSEVSRMRQPALAALADRTRTGEKRRALPTHF